MRALKHGENDQLESQSLHSELQTHTPIAAKTDEQKHTRPSMKRSSFLRLCVRVCVVKIATAELRSCTLG
jgi:hypothetical protein